MQNKQRAIKRLQSILLAQQDKNNANAVNGAWRKHTEIERGNPIRIYEGNKFKLIQSKIQS